MGEARTEQEARAVRVLCDFGNGVRDAGTGVAIRGGIVLTARHVLYDGENLAQAIELVWASSSDQEDPLPANVMEGCECGRLDVTLLYCERPPLDIGRLPQAVLATEITRQAPNLVGDGFPVLTDESGIGSAPTKHTIDCTFFSTDSSRLVLKISESCSASYLNERSAEEIDRALAGASGTGLFDDRERLAAVFLARAHKNTTHVLAVPISEILDAFGQNLQPRPLSEKLMREIMELSGAIEGLQDILRMDTLDALREIEKALSDQNLDDCRRLACLVFAYGCDAEEVAGIRTALETKNSIIDVHTTRFGGAERRIAGAEDRPVSWSELKADPRAEYRLMDAPDAGISGVPEGTDFIGALGVDLNQRLDEPFSGAPEKAQMTDLMDEVLYELNRRHEQDEPKYYYAARYNNTQVDTRARQVSERFQGLVPFLRLQKPHEANHDREMLSALLKILKRSSP